MKLNCSGLIDAIEAYIRKADDDLGKKLADEGYLNAGDTVDAASDLEDQVAETLKNETDYLLDKLNESVDVETFFADIWPDVKDGDNVADKLFDIFKGSFDSIMPQLITAYLQDTDKDLILEEVGQRTAVWIDDWSSELADLMKLNSHTEIESILHAGMANGKSVAEVTQDILDNGIRDEYYKARRVSITEMLRAHSVAREEALRQSPAVESKEWKHTGSYRNAPRANHVAMDGQIVKKTDPFELTAANGTVYHPMYPRDSVLPAAESINCHCIHRGIVSKEVLGLSLEERRKLQAEAIATDNGEWEKEIDAKNKSKASIDEETINLDWVKGKTKDDQVKYLKTKNRWALVESGVIKDDKGLENLFKKKVSSSGKTVKSLKSLKELEKDGIMTVSNPVNKHAAVGEFSKPSKTYPSGRLKSGGHGQSNIDELESRGSEYTVVKTYKNGVRIGHVPNHANRLKRSGTGQAWFPEDWTDDDILCAGTYVVNTSKSSKNPRFGEYNGVRIGIFIDDDDHVSTIFPDNNKQVGED